MLAPYLDTLIGKLLALLQRGRRNVQESALTALASVADCAQVGGGVGWGVVVGGSVRGVCLPQHASLAPHATLAPTAPPHLPTSPLSQTPLTAPPPHPPHTHTTPPAGLLCQVLRLVHAAAVVHHDSCL